MNRMELLLDDDDYRDIQQEIALRQVEGRTLPDGDSSLAGAMLAEMVRDLREYRSLWDAEHP